MMVRWVSSGSASRKEPSRCPWTMMNTVFTAVRDIIVQGQREGTFRDADPLLTHLTIMPPILIFFARERVLAHNQISEGLAAPRPLDEFVRHMQASARGMLRKDP